MPLSEILKTHARTRPTAVATWCDGVATSYGELFDRVARLYGWLSGHAGVTAGDRVAILSENSSEYIICYGLAEAGGAVLVPLNFRLTAPELLATLENAQPKVLIFEENYTETATELRKEADFVETWICIGDGPDWATGFGSALASATPAPLPDVADDALAYLIYTSGSTGRPKGVMLDHAGQLACARILADSWALSEETRLLLAMPIFHLGGRGAQLAQQSVGGATLIHQRFDERRFCRDVQEYRITTTLLAPTMIQRIIDLPDVDEYDLSSLQTIVYSAAPMPPSLLRRALDRFGPVVEQAYGMTESGPLGTALLKSDHVVGAGAKSLARLGSAGRACKECEVAILAEDGTIAAPGEPGEILVRTPSVMVGYWQNPQATNEVLRNGWLHTGDVGTMDEDGYVTIVDRKKDMIVSGGENIYSREVEEAIMAHSSVREAAVIGVPDPKWGESVKAIVVLNEGMAATAADLIAHCQTLIASYKKPKSVDFIDRLPRLSSGKIDKVTLRRTFGDAERLVAP